MKIQTVLLAVIAFLLVLNLIYAVRPVEAQGNRVYVTAVGPNQQQVVPGSVVGFACSSANYGCFILSQ